MLLPLVLSLSVLIVSAEEVITLHARAKPSFQSTKGVFDFAHGQQAALAALVKFKPNFVVPNSTIIPKINSIPAPVKSVLGLKKRSSGALGQQPLLNYGPDILYYGGISVGSR